MDEIKTILLIDDNKTTLQLNRWLLKDFFPEEKIYSKCSGKEAIDFIETHLADSGFQNSIFPLLVFCDVQMPDFGGWDFVEYLKSHPQIDMDQLYIILLSAYIQPKGKEKQCADRNVICINKPLMDNNIEEIKQTFALAF